MNALNTLLQHGQAMRAIVKAQKERLAPLISEATRRAFRIAHDVQGVDSQLRLLDRPIEERRAHLEKAGIGSEEIDLILERDCEECKACRCKLNTHRAELLAEQERLENFMRTRNEQYLPEGFRVAEVLRVDARGAA